MRCWENNGTERLQAELELWDACFDSGDCMCPFWCQEQKGKSFAHTGVLDAPPEWCPFAAEHVVETQRC